MIYLRLTTVSVSSSAFKEDETLTIYMEKSGERSNEELKAHKHNYTLVSDDGYECILLQQFTTDNSRLIMLQMLLRHFLRYFQWLENENFSLDFNRITIPLFPGEDRLSR